MQQLHFDNKWTHKESQRCRNTSLKAEKNQEMFSCFDTDIKKRFYKQVDWWWRKPRHDSSSWFKKTELFKSWKRRGNSRVAVEPSLLPSTFTPIQAWKEAMDRGLCNGHQQSHLHTCLHTTWPVFDVTENSEKTQRGRLVRTAVVVAGTSSANAKTTKNCTKPRAQKMTSVSLWRWWWRGTI